MISHPSPSLLRIDKCNSVPSLMLCSLMLMRSSWVGLQHIGKVCQSLLAVPK